MVRLDASLAAFLKEVAQAFVQERFDHRCIVLCNVTLHNHIANVLLCALREVGRAE
jgi:hypothetical protein